MLGAQWAREGCGSIYAIVGINHHGTRWGSQSSCSALVVNNRGRGFESRTKELRTLCDGAEPGSGIPESGERSYTDGKSSPSRPKIHWGFTVSAWCASTFAFKGFGPSPDRRCTEGADYSFVFCMYVLSAISDRHYGTV